MRPARRNGNGRDAIHFRFAAQHRQANKLDLRQPNRLAIGYRYAMTLAVLAIVCSACALLVACGVVQVR